MSSGLLELLGIVRTAQAQVARLISGHEDADDRVQTRRDLPMTLGVIEHALASLQAWLEYDQARDVLTIHGKQYTGALFGPEGLGGQPGTLFRIMDAGAVTTVQTFRGFSDAARDVLAERLRQIEREGYTAERDDQLDDGELAAAGSAYALAAADELNPHSQGDGHYGQGGKPPTVWPWDWVVWKPAEDPRRNLVKAAALLLAEIERVDREEARRQLEVRFEP